MNQNNNLNTSDNGTRLANTKLSKASLILLILQFIMPILTIFLGPFKFLVSLPYLLASLVLAIISKCQYNDKLSSIMIIVDIILMVIGLILAFLVIILFASIFESMLSGCTL